MVVWTVVDVTSPPTVTICSCLNSLSEGKVENITNHCSVQFETFIVPSITGFCISFVLHSCPCRRLCDFCDDPSVNSNRIPVSHCILASSPRATRRESPRPPLLPPCASQHPNSCILITAFHFSLFTRRSASSCASVQRLSCPNSGSSRSFLPRRHVHLHLAVSSFFSSPPPLPPPLAPPPPPPPSSPTLSPCSPSSRLHH